jgi:hypothetical protein
VQELGEIEVGGDGDGLGGFIDAHVCYIGDQMIVEKGRVA